MKNDCELETYSEYFTRRLAQSRAFEAWAENYRDRKSKKEKAKSKKDYQES